MTGSIRLSHVMVLAVLGLAGAHRAAIAEESFAEFIDDAATTARVKTALLADSQVSGTDIEVETDKGTVQLSGYVDSDAERERAELLAKTVSGVKAVDNDLRLKSEPAR